MSNFQCTLSSFAQINCIHLTKEIVLSEKIDPSSFLYAVPPKLLQLAVKNILIPSKQVAYDLGDLLLKNSQPEVTDVLDVFNAAVGSNLLVVAENNIQIDADEFENALSNSAKHVSRVLYPDNKLQQLVAYKMFQKEIAQLSPQFKDAFSSAKVPVEQLESLLPKQPHALGKRDVSLVLQQKNLFDDILYEVERAFCNTLVAEITTVVDSTIADWINNLKSLDISTDDSNVFSSVLAGSLQVVVFFTEQGLNCTDQWWDNYSGGVCDSLLSYLNNNTSTSERKRRDVEVSITQKTNMFLSLFTGVGGVIWVLVAPLINFVAKLAVSWLASLFVYSVNIIIDEVFPSTW